MLISVVIPTCHRNDLLAKCLDCLAPGKQAGGEIEGMKSESSPSSFTYEVVVTDDGSKTAAQELIQRSYPWARWVAGPRKGPAANRNNGAKNAKGEWLVFTDDDCIPDRGFLPGYHKAAREEAASVLEGRTEAYGKKIAADYECPVNLTGGYLWSCNFAIRAGLFHNLGGFDESLPAPAMEDVEFRWRLEDSRQPMRFVSDAVVRHPWRPLKGWPFPSMYAKSVAYCLKKHPDRKAQFAMRAQFHNTVRFMILIFPKDVASFQGRGAFRRMALSMLSSLSVLRNIGLR